MPTFSTKLPAQGKHQGFDLCRTPTNSALQAIITSDQLLVCDTHFWHGRTMPCERVVNENGKTLDDSACLACQQKQPFRTHVYVSAFNAKSHEHFIFECTATAAKPLEEHASAAGTLRGCIFHASRPKGGPNSKVVILTNVANPRNVQLPAAPNVAAALAVIWRLPRQAIEVILTEPGLPTIRPVADVLNDIRNQEDDAEGPTAFEARKAIIDRALTAAANGNGRRKKSKEPA